MDPSSGKLIPMTLGTCGVPGSKYTGHINELLLTNPAGIHYFLNTRTVYFTSLVHPGVFRGTLSDDQASRWQQTVAQGSSLQATSSADALLAGVDFGIMTIDMETAEAKWFTGGSVARDNISDPLSTEFSQVVDLMPLSDSFIVISDKAQNRLSNTISQFLSRWYL